MQITPAKWKDPKEGASSSPEQAQPNQTVKMKTLPATAMEQYLTILTKFSQLSWFWAVSMDPCLCSSDIIFPSYGLSENCAVRKIGKKALGGKEEDGQSATFALFTCSKFACHSEQDESLRFAYLGGNGSNLPKALAQPRQKPVAHLALCGAGPPEFR